MTLRLSSYRKRSIARHLRSESCLKSHRNSLLQHSPNWCQPASGNLKKHHLVSPRLSSCNYWLVSSLDTVMLDVDRRIGARCYIGPPSHWLALWCNGRHSGSKSRACASVPAAHRKKSRTSHHLEGCRNFHGNAFCVVGRWQRRGFWQHLSLYASMRPSREPTQAIRRK